MSSRRAASLSEMSTRSKYNRELILVEPEARELRRERNLDGYVTIGVPSVRHRREHSELGIGAGLSLSVTSGTPEGPSTSGVKRLPPPSRRAS